MELALAITSYQRLSPTVTTNMRCLASRSYVLGRLKECDWYLPDPDRVVSSRHAEIFYRDQHFCIRDHSSNGVFINGANEPLGRGNEVVLKHGDKLRFGDYEISVTLHLLVDSDASLSSASPALPDSPSATPLTPQTEMPLSGLHAGAALSAPGSARAASQNRWDTAAHGDVPLQEAIGENPMLASGLNEHRLGDSHIEIPAVDIPSAWRWGADASSRQAPASSSSVPDSHLPESHLPESHLPKNHLPKNHLTALFEGMGMPQLAEKPLPPEQMRDLGELTRQLLDRLLDLLHARAAQKQKLRATQTLFQRSENNPLKFSVTAEDALEAFLVRRHSSFLGYREAVDSAFDDILAHERALMAGVEGVLNEIFQQRPSKPKGIKRLAPLRKSGAYDALIQQQRQQKDEFGTTHRMLSSDVFAEAYESAVRQSDKEF